MSSERRYHRLGFLSIIGILLAAGSFAAELTKDVNVKFFFPATGTQNPTSTVPNWYYYWTDELQNGPHSYTSYIAGDQYAVTTCSNHSVQIQIADKAFVTTGNLPRWPGQNYIDAFGIIVSHEQWHRLHLNHNISSHLEEANCSLPDIEDSDRDFLCDREPGDPPGHNGGLEQQYGTDPFNDRTYGIIDPEYIAIQHERDPNASSDDWAHPGSQWH